MGREQQANNDGFEVVKSIAARRRPESGDERIVFTHDNLSTVCAGLCSAGYRLVPPYPCCQFRFRMA